jgi:hypothetical protein
LQQEFAIQLGKAQFEFYSRKISKLRKTKPKQWHRELKKLSSFDQNEGEELCVESIKDLTNKEQAEIIAENFTAISQEYDKLETEDIEVPEFTEEAIPIYDFIRERY